jgi:beta-galactosidase
LSEGPKRARFAAGEKEGTAPRLAGASLLLDGRSVPLRSGAMHYWRLRRENWRPALRALRDLGLEMVETYAPWSVHETAPGVYDFGETDERKDLGAFIDLAEEEGLLCFVRPGPHINAELTYFGLPEWIVSDPAMQARTPRNNPVVLYFPPRMFPVPSHASDAYHDAVAQWYAAVGAVIAPRLYPKGPVVLLQVDNEAGFFFRNGPFCQDYHPDSITLWEEFVSLRYGGTEEAAVAFEQETAKPPHSFGSGHWGEEPSAGEFRRQLAWAEFQEHTLTTAMSRMKKSMQRAGMKGVPILHNISLGESGLPVSIPALDRNLDLVGLDYYHPARDHAAIKRRTLYLAGTCDVPYAPELGVGAPPWFTPLAHRDSLFCGMAASAYGLRGFNLYMTVDRDRWYGAIIDTAGRTRAESVDWSRFLAALERTRFHDLTRRASVGLVIPREYARLSRATHTLGAASPATLEAMGGGPTDGCRRDALGLGTPIQVRWWEALERVAEALTNAGVSYNYIDSEASAKHWRGYDVLYSPTFRFANPKRYAALLRANEKARVLVGPEYPAQNHEFNDEDFGERLALLDVFDERALQATVVDWVARYSAARPYATTPPLDTELHVDGERDAVLFVINPTSEDRDAEINLPAPTLARDLLSAEEFQGDTVLRLRVPAFTVRLLELEAQRRGGAPSARRER